MGSLFGIKKPEVDQSAYQVPDYDNLMTRFMAVLDGYMKDKGFDKHIPADRRPYEYLSPEEQAATREQQAQAASSEDKGEKVAPVKPKPAKPEQATEAEDPQMVTQDARQPELMPRYTNAAFAAALKAKREGVDPTELALTAPKALAEQNVAQQQQAMNDISNFIRNGRRVRRAYG